MKKIIWILGSLGILGSLAYGDINVTQGSGKTVHTDTVNGLEYQAIKIIDGTTGGTSSMTVTGAGAAKVDGSAVTQPVSVATPYTVIQSSFGTSASTINVVNANGTQITVVSTGIPVSIGAAVTVVSTGIPIIPSTIGQPVISTFTTVVSTGLPIIPSVIGQPVTSTFTTVVSTGLLILPSTIGQPVTSTSSLNSVVISSTALSGGFTQGATQQVWGTSIGQIMATGIPYNVAASTWNTSVSSQTSNDFVFIASATAPNYNYLCGCVFANSGGSAVTMTIYQSSSTIPGIEYESITVPAGETRGHWPGCMQPFFRSKAGGQLTMKASATSTSTAMRCQYYSAP